MSLKTNVTKVRFNKLQFLQVKPLTQFDKGQVIEFLDDYIEDGIEVQFSNAESEETINRLVEDKKVSIPDILLESPYQIYAWVKIVTTDSETTVKGIGIPIQNRVKPSGYTAPEDEPTMREKILGIFNDTKEIAQSVRNDADAGKFMGVSGVYVGSGEMPEGYNVQIDPDGDELDIVKLLIDNLPCETWVFTLKDGTEVEKKVVLL